MNLVSCDKCGAVLDKDKLYFPPTWGDDGQAIRANGVWRGTDFIAVVACPVCDGNILEE
jgi:hypothetical protein